MNATRWIGLTLVVVTGAVVVAASFALEPQPIAAAAITNNSAAQESACFERVIVYLVPDEAASADKFIPDGMIYKVDQRKETDKARSPRGVIVSAGLAALDILVGNGMQLG